jgi:hypothetical protein
MAPQPQNMECTVFVVSLGRWYAVCSPYLLPSLTAGVIRVCVEVASCVEVPF